MFYYLNFIIRLLFIVHKDYNNHLGAYIAGTQNSTGAYIIMACLQALVNNLLVWQSSCVSNLCPATHCKELLVNTVPVFLDAEVGAVSMETNVTEGEML